MAVPKKAPKQQLDDDHWELAKDAVRRRMRRLTEANTGASPESTAYAKTLKVLWQAAKNRKESTDAQRVAADRARQVWRRRRAGVRPREEYVGELRADELRERVIQLRLAGGSASAIARIVKRSRTRVRQILEEELEEN
jgi:hypothetical protein